MTNNSVPDTERVYMVPAEIERRSPLAGRCVLACEEVILPKNVLLSKQTASTRTYRKRASSEGEFLCAVNRYVLAEC